MHLKKYSILSLLICLIYVIPNCKNNSPLEPDSSSQIQLNLSFAKSLNKSISSKNASILDSMTVQVFNSASELIASTDLTKSDSTWNGELKLKPTNNLRVTVEAFEGTILKYTGEAENVNVEAGKTTEVNIVLESVLQPTFSSIQDNIFTPKCVNRGCHPGGAAPFSLQAGVAYNNLVNVPSAFSMLRVEPGNANNSALYLKIIGDSRVGARMPLGWPPLTQEEIEAIRDWIDSGALNN